MNKWQKEINRFSKFCYKTKDHNNANDSYRFIRKTIKWSARTFINLDEFKHMHNKYINKRIK